MNLSRLRDLCMGLAGATEQIQWGDHLVFKVGGRIFCIAATEAAPPHVCSFKCDREAFAELAERDGLCPAPYLARAQWIAAETWDALTDGEYKALLPRAYAIVRAKLPRTVQAALAAAPPTTAPRRGRAARVPGRRSPGG